MYKSSIACSNIHHLIKISDIGIHTVSINNMFESSSFNQDISEKTVTVGEITYIQWDTSNIKSVNSLFQNNTQFDKDMSIGTFKQIL